VSFDHGFALSTVDQTGVGKGGDIRISAEEMSVTNGAQLGSSTFGKGDTGNVIIDASGKVSFDNGFALSAVAQTGVGKGGDIRISADSISVTNGAQLVSSTFGKGDAGNVIIDARGKVSFDGTSSDAFSRVEQTGVGKGGDIRISADSLFVTNGAQLVANTNGQGDAGNIEINAPNSFSVKGTSSSTGFSSGLFTSTDSNSTGSGGDITVNTPVLRVSDGAVLDARTWSNRNGGNITLNVKLAEILNGGQLLSTSSGAGNAGKITVNATDRVIVDGSDSTFNNRVAKFGPDVVAPVDASSGFFVRSQSTGSAGDIEVTSPQIRLDNEARFIAESASGNGGNINLQVRDLLLLRHGSLISTSAGTANAGGNGGNITINSPNGFIVALPDENSDISANAYTGIGGRVQINATGVYGIRFRDKQNPQTSDITASSEFGSAGTVQLNIPNNDPTQGLSTLSGELVNVENLIANSCIARTHQKPGGTFFITGADGLPNRPGDVSVSSYPTGEVRSLPGSATSRPWRKGDPIVEPQGVYQLPNGHLVLSRECNN
ncbi:MAG: S-layer family protein, partial [Stigonema ocellatum SAG 48.90 = DSM 106950]|nr:S-layer family protein [Stigonema ocellatum SAG 48.90 = DSM 106950]